MIVSNLVFFSATALFGSAVAEYILPPVKNVICPRMASKNACADSQKFHSDKLCDRKSYHAFKQTVSRHLRYQHFKNQGGIPNVPNQRTAVCPLQMQDWTTMEQQFPTASAGLDTIWIVENTASTPVVLSYVNEEGIEVSAQNPEITPAVLDPTAILQPGQWMSVHTFEGHVFLARPILQGGLVGPVLLQHRAGLIPIGAHAANNLECPEEDIEPMLNNETHPHYRRTRSHEYRPCNTLDVGFRNMASCPLHAYYVTTKPGANETQMCAEQFKFHLGVQKTGLADYMWDWKSQTKYEGTFMGHSFSFRLAANPAVLVETVTLQPTRITDCPDTGVAVPISVEGGPQVPELISGNIYGNQSRFEFEYISANNTTGNYVKLSHKVFVSLQSM